MNGSSAPAGRDRVASLASRCGQWRKPQDLTRIKNDYTDVRGFVPKAMTPPMAAYGLSCFLFNDLGTRGFPRQVNKERRETRRAVGGVTAHGANLRTSA